MQAQSPPTSCHIQLRSHSRILTAADFTKGVKLSREQAVQSILGALILGQGREESMFSAERSLATNYNSGIVMIPSPILL